MITSTLTACMCHILLLQGNELCNQMKTALATERPHAARRTSTSSQADVPSGPFPTEESVTERIIQELEAGGTVQSCAGRLIKAAREALQAGGLHLRNWHEALSSFAAGAMVAFVETACKYVDSDAVVAAALALLWAAVELYGEYQHWPVVFKMAQPVLVQSVGVHFPQAARMLKARLALRQDQRGAQISLVRMEGLTQAFRLAAASGQ